MNRISDAALDTIRTLLEEGNSTVREISQVARVSEMTVRKYADLWEMEPRSGRRRHSAETISAIADLLRQGKTQAQVASETGVNKAVVQYHAGRLGIQPPADPARTAPAGVYLDPPYPAIDGRQPCAKDPEFFFPKTEDQLSNRKRELKRLCEHCPFTKPCREYAIAHDVDGWWGGMSKRQRSRYRTEHGIKAHPMRSPRLAQPTAELEAS